MGRNRDVNIQFVPIRRKVKVFWLRFDQATMASLDHEAGGGTPGLNTAEGIRHGDFNLVALHFHFDQGVASRKIMDEGSATVFSDLVGG
jgi:hypothetical protein